MAAIRPFRVHVGDDQIADLRRRIAATRWPDEVNDDDWSYGARLTWVRRLADYWAGEFDWRAAEAAINRFDQYLVEIDGLDLHCIHQRSPHRDALPLVITHGWPGSVVEFLDVIDRLTRPEQYGGRAEDAFHVVCPSLPGYAWSQAASGPGMHTRRIAERHARLMQLLGYDRYMAQGGDWGAIVSSHLADLDAGHCVALHSNMLFATPPDGIDDPMALVTDDERGAMARDQDFSSHGLGYYRIQATRPQTLGYGLNDSPVGLAAWIGEKFHGWTDCGGEVERAVSLDRLLTNIAVYWFTGTITSSMRLYYEESRGRVAPGRIEVPTGGAIYPYELLHTPRAWLERAYNLVYLSHPEKGGHFAAMEQPEQFCRDLWAFRQVLRERGLLAD